MTNDLKKPENLQPQPNEAKTRRTYHQPELVRYGQLAKLTQGGTGTAKEGSAGQKPRP
jgi:hypothetical protein